MAIVTLLSGYGALASALAANGTPTELAVSNGYARQAMNLYYDTATGSVTFQGVDFGPATGSWTAAVAFVLYDASSGGNAALNYPLTFTGASGLSLNLPGFTVARTVPFSTTTAAGIVIGTNASGANVTLGPAAMTLSSANAWSAAPPITVLTYAASITPNAATGGPVWQVTLTGALTFVAPTNPVPGTRYRVYFIQDGTGSRLLTLSGFKTAGGAPTLTTTAAGIDVYDFFYDGTNFYGVLSKAYA